MISKDRCREILGNPELTDEEIDKIQMHLRDLVGVILEDLESGNEK